MKDFTKIVCPGWIRCGQKLRRAFVSIRHIGGVLSLTGVVGPRAGGAAYGSCGQIVDELKSIEKRAPGWSPAAVKRLQACWREWHLNDAHAGCEHQEKDERALEAELDLFDYCYGGNYATWKASVLSGALRQSVYKQRCELLREADGAVANYHGPGLNVRRLIDCGLVKMSRTHRHKAYWVSVEDHPDGILGRVCPECGWKYGGAWRRVEVPDDVIQWLKELPDTTTAPVWIC
jgi:hypothetical protein